jgi:hypothetical protein
MKKFEITKEQINYYYDKCDSVGQVQLMRDFPKAFETELEDGKWYKWLLYTNKPVFLFVESFKNGNKVKAYGLDNSIWFDNRNELNYWGYKTDKYWILATEQEVTTVLIEEAKKRGFKEGVTISSTGINEFKQDEYKPFSGNFSFKPKLNILECKNGNGHIFDNGTWATIIPQEVELTLEEIAEKFNIDVNQLKIKK